MSIDVATLVFEFKSDSAVAAEQRMDALIAKGERLEDVARRAKSASERLNESHRAAAAATERAASAQAANERAIQAAERAATQAAAREAAAWAKVEAALDKRNAKLRGELALRAMKEEAAAAANLERRMAALKASVDPVGAAQDRVNREMQEAAALYKAGAISAEQYAMSMRVLDERYRMVTVANTGAARAMNKTSLAALDLSRQFADVGVTAAMGMSPLLILIQQGPQIADRLAMMRMEGIGLGAALKGIWVSMAPLLPLFAAIAAVSGVIFGGAALAARALNKEAGDLTKGLGLTEKQMERLKDKGVETGVTIGDVFRGTFRFIADSVGPMLAPVAKWFSDMFDRVTKGAVAAAKIIVGAWAGYFAIIKEVWSNLPRVIGDVAISAANAVVNAVEKSINKAIDAYNRALPLIRAMMMATGQGGLAMTLREAGPVSLGEIRNPYAGEARATTEAAVQAGRAAAQAAAEGVDRVLAQWGEAIKEAGRDRIRKAADDAEAERKAKARRAPRDMNEERTAEIQRLIEAAKQEQLQAELALTQDLDRRAEIEKEIATAAMAQKQAQVNRMAAAIRDDKGLSDAKKRELLLALGVVSIMNQRTLEMQKQAIDEAKRRELARQELDLAQARMDAEIDLLESRAALAKSSFGRAVIEVEILRKQQRAERERLGHITERNGYSKQEVKLAQERLAVLDDIHANEMAAAKEGTRLIDAVTEAKDAVSGFADAFRRGDWVGVLGDLKRTIELIQFSFARYGVAGGMTTLGAVAAQAIGGKTGAALGGALSIGTGVSAIGGYLLNAGSMGSLGAFSGTAMAIGSIAGPLAIAAAALYAAAKLFNLGGKPSNQGAGYDLITGQFSGNKRTQETEDAARAAGDAIKAIQEGLKASGIELNDAVRGLVIGTRDLSQIYLTSGKTLTSAVGDSAAAVDAALRALLESATFASDAQRQVAMAALAAGGGFEAVAAALDKYAQAQQISANLADEILRLTDPKAYDIQAVTRAIEEQRKAAKALADEGFLAADQLATINDQLSTLERLQLDEVMKRYTDAVDGAAEALRKAKEYSDRIFQVSRNIMAMDAEIRRLKGDTAGAKAIQRQLELERTDPLARDKLRQLWAAQDLAEARERLVEAHRAAADAVDSLIEARDRAFEAVEAAEERVISLYQRSVDELVRTADRLKDMVARIRDYRMGLNVSQGTPATSYLAARNEFLRISAAARGGDEDAIGKLTGVSDEFLQASLAYHTDSIAYLKDLAAVKTAAAATEQLGEAQLTENEKQRKLLEKQIEGLVKLDKGLDDLETAIGELLSARQAAEIADREAQAAQAQLQAMEGQIGQLVTLNQGVVSVEQRLVELRGALNALSQLQGGGGGAGVGKGGGGGAGVGWTPDPWEVVDGVHIDPSNPNIDKAWNPNNDWMSFDEVTGKRINLGLGPNNLPLNLFEGWRDVHPDAADWMDPAEIAAAREAWLAQQAAERAARNARVHDLATGTTEEALEFQRKYVDPFRNLPGFATGGEIMVGGSGGPDSQLVSLWASPNESIQIRRPDQRDDTAEEVRALRSTVERLEKALIAITVNSGKAARAIDSIERDGVYARGPDPDAPVVTEAA